MNSHTAFALRFPVLPDSLPRKLFIALALTGLADWLFYEHTPGISAALFLAILAGLSLLTNPLHAGWRQFAIAATLLVAGLSTLIEEFNILSASLAVLALAVCVSSLSNRFIEGFADRLAALQDLLITGPFRIFADVARSSKLSLTLRYFTVWVVPLALSCVFLVLFSSANPLIDNWLKAIDLRALLARISVARLLFWTVTLCVVWPFIYLKWIRRPPAEPSAISAEAAADTAPGELFGAAAILRSLLLFNALFAVQTGLDIVYLWGGVALPDGLTYAAYAHRGAYPLIVTALLAAGFVLAAMRPDGPATRTPVIRALVFLWVAQNVMLVISSILRLDLYVQIYSLTYWRIAAFVWMLLVGAGLLLIVARIALNRSNQWLVLMNVATLALTAWVCAFINFPGFIAMYNVDHSIEVSRKGQLLDRNYLLGLGPQAIPALDRYILALPDMAFYVYDRGQLAAGRGKLVSRQLAELDSWRAWTFRGHRLRHYLAGAPVPTLQSPPVAGKGDKG